MSRRDRATTHGTTSAYTNHGCRCGECRAAHAAQQREYYAANRERIAERRREAVASGSVPHGTYSAYTSGCRCDQCRAANAAYRREYYAANRERIAAQRREYRARKRGAA